METNINRPVVTQDGKTGYRRAGRFLQDGAALISIEEYAAKEGVSAELIETCRLAGIVQVRKHKGEKYIVDYPLTPYSSSSLQAGTSRPAASARPSQITRTAPREQISGEQNRTTGGERSRTGQTTIQADTSSVTKNNPQPVEGRTAGATSGEQNRTIAAGSIADLAKKMYLKTHPSVLLSQDSSRGKPLEPIEKPSEIQVR